MSRCRTAILLLTTGLNLASAPAAAQELEQVQGFVANATLRYRATFANMLGSAPGTITYNYSVRISGSVATASVSREVEADTSMGPVSDRAAVPSQARSRNRGSRITASISGRSRTAF